MRKRERSLTFLPGAGLPDSMVKSAPIGVRSSSRSRGTTMAEAVFPTLKRVLVVEDDRPLCGALARIARTSSEDVREAHTVAEGSALLAQQRPQLMIVDLWLEGESAMGLIEKAAKH